VAQDDGRFKDRRQVVSRPVSRGAEADQQEVAGVAAQHTGPRQRRRRVAAGLAVLVVLGAGGAGAWRAGAFSAAATSGARRLGAPALATRPVMREDLSATTPVAATLGYAASYPVTGEGVGTLTELPPAGQVIRQGQALYRVDNGSPVVLLYGSVPAWRTLEVGVTGADVAQLNHDLVALGDAGRAQVSAPGWDYFSWETMSGVQRLEEHLQVSFPPGSLPLGSALFEPEALRVSQVTGSLGGPASGPVLATTSDRHVVMIPLDVSQESEVKTGDRVSVTLPDGTTAPGMVSAVSTVATTTSGPGQNPATAIPVTVTLTDLRTAGSLDQAPVTVNITTGSSPGPVLAVPADALLAQASGGYVVEIAGPGNSRRYVPVTPGIFDDTSGLVQVTGALRPGQRVVVPAS
jgi:hypothetical protein